MRRAGAPAHVDVASDEGRAAVWVGVEAVFGAEALRFGDVLFGALEGWGWARAWEWDGEGGGGEGGEDVDGAHGGTLGRLWVWEGGVWRWMVVVSVVRTTCVL